jgi:hypothetical protein
MKKNKFPIFKCKNREEEFYHVFCKRIKEDLKNILGNNLPTKFKALEVAPTWQESQFLNGYYDGGYKVENSNLYSNNVIYLQKKNEEDCKKGNVYFWEMEGETMETMDEVYSEWSFLLTGYDIRGYLTKEEYDSIQNRKLPKDIESAIKRLKDEINCETFYFGSVKRKNEEIIEGRRYGI